MAAWKSGRRMVLHTAAVQRGVGSAPPPNQVFVVTMKRVFMCTAGTKGFHGWMMSEMPEAQARIPPRRRNLLAELGGEFLVHGGSVHARLLEENLAVQHGHDAAHRRLSSPTPSGAPKRGPASISSRAAQIRSRRVSNQRRAAARLAGGKLFCHAQIL